MTNYIAQARAAEAFIDEMIETIEAEGFVRVPDTNIWQKRDEQGRVTATVDF